MRALTILLAATITTPAISNPYWTIARVNKEVNHDLRPMDDMVQYGKPLMVIEPVSGYGDCEDYAITKIIRLRKLGIFGRMHVVKTETGESHAVASVDGWILDNRFKKPQRVEWLERFGYQFTYKTTETPYVR